MTYYRSFGENIGSRSRPRVAWEAGAVRPRRFHYLPPAYPYGIAFWFRVWDSNGQTYYGTVLYHENASGFDRMALQGNATGATFALAGRDNNNQADGTFCFWNTTELEGRWHRCYAYGKANNDWETYLDDPSTPLRTSTAALGSSWATATFFACPGMNAKNRDREGANRIMLWNGNAPHPREAFSALMQPTWEQIASCAVFSEVTPQGLVHFLGYGQPMPRTNSGGSLLSTGASEGPPMKPLPANDPRLDRRRRWMRRVIR